MTPFSLRAAIRYTACIDSAGSRRGTTMPTLGDAYKRTGRGPKPVLTKEVFGPRIREARIKAGYPTVKAAADHLEMDVIAYGNIERGERMPMLPLLIPIITGLGLDVSIVLPELFPEGNR